MNQRPINELPQVDFLVRPGSDFLAPAVQSYPARRARPTQGRPPRLPRSELDASRPALTGRAPWYHGERPCRSSAWRWQRPDSPSSGMLGGDLPCARSGHPRERASPAWAETALAGSVARPSFGRAIARDPSPAGARGPPKYGRKRHRGNVMLFPAGLRLTPRR
jgi:hypothetical protein